MNASQTPKPTLEQKINNMSVSQWQLDAELLVPYFEYMLTGYHIYHGSDITQTSSLTQTGTLEEQISSHFYARILLS